MPTSPHTDPPTPEPCTVMNLPLDDREPALVRPYVVANERGEQRRTDVAPRVEPVCAPHSMAVTQ